MDERFLKDEGAEVFTGNELIVKGALESRVALITGYPGSPVSDVFDTAYANRDLLKRHGILAEMANNEALAVARLNGSRMAGVRAMAVMKSVGLHVAADGLALGNLSEPNNAGGSVVVVGDDPWIDSTQINNDSRYLSQHLHMPVLEPATFQEIKDWVGTAFELSSAANLYITYLVTTNQADGGGTVWVRPNHYPGTSTQRPVNLETSKIDLDTNVLLPPRTWTREASLPSRFEKLLVEARHYDLNKEIGGRDGRKGHIGFVASGLVYCYLEHALSEMGLTGKFPILKLGLTYPVDPQAILSLARDVGVLYVIEEKRGFIESQVIQILHEARQAGSFHKPVEVWGKQFPHRLPGIPENRGLNASIISQCLLPLFLSELKEIFSESELARLRAEQAILNATKNAALSLPVRTPTFCPGCPHRDSSSVFLEIKRDFMDSGYMKRTHSTSPVDLVFHGETGCFTMLMFEPNKELMHNYSGMGLGGGTGAGLDPFVSNKQVVFLGDSTFFHSGMIAVSDSIKSGQDITYVILDNKTTAMTGHQPTPGTEINLMGERTFVQNIEKILQGMAGSLGDRGETGIPVQRVNPEYRDSYRALLEETILEDGVKIIIADKECGITYHRRRRKERKTLLRRDGYLSEENHINITPEVCEFCLECTKTTGCPGLTIEETLYGPKIVTDMTQCVSDGACAKVKACPSFEEVIVRRKNPPRKQFLLPGLQDLPAVPSNGRQASSDDRLNDPFYIFTAGVGGMGAGLVSAILVQAAQRDGYRVLFSDKKGLAIRNGGVYGHILLSKEGGVLSPLVPYGKADLILGIDLLEVARGLDPTTNLRVARPERTCAVVNTANNPTIRMLMGSDEPAGNSFQDLIRKQLKPDGYWGQDVSMISDYFFGSKIYANMLLLGAAVQLGVLPLSVESMNWAISRMVPKEDRQMNLNAFAAGRALIVRPEQFRIPAKIYTYRSLLEEKKRFLEESAGKASAEAYRYLVEEAVLELGLDDAAHKHLALRAYELWQYDGQDSARQYINLVLAIAHKDRSEWNYQATRAIILYAFKVMAIKDEVYVAYLLTSPEKRERDHARFRVDEANGDRLDYRHLTRPELVIFGRRFRWDMVTRDWQLRIMKRMKFLRRWLPDWHRHEKKFRDWYLGLAAHFEADDERAYQLWIKILSSPEDVKGYREIRCKSIAAAREKVNGWLADLAGAAPSTLSRTLSADSVSSRQGKR